MTVLSRKPGGSGGGGAPSGPAGGDLAGTYPNPTLSSQGSADGLALISDGAGGTAFERPPGFELAYAEKTTTTSITATTEGTADTIVSAGAVTYDGTPVWVEFGAAYVNPHNVAGSQVTICINLDGTSQGKAWFCVKDHTATDFRGITGCSFKRKLTPTAASHTILINAFVNSGTGEVEGGAGGSGNYTPAYIRITKA